MRAAYVKNGAVCVAGGAVVVGTDSAEPPCVCGDVVPTIDDVCCPPSLPAYLPPRSGPTGFGTILVNINVITRGLRFAPSLPPPVTIATVQETVFVGPVSMTRAPSGNCPVGGPFSVMTTETVTTTNSDTVNFPQFQPGTTVRTFFVDFFVVFDRYGVGNTKLQCRLIGAGSPVWRQTPAESFYQAIPAGGTPVLSGMGSTLSATYARVGTAGPGSTYNDSYQSSISGLAACVAPGSNLVTGCSNCPDNLTGSAVI